MTITENDELIPATNNECVDAAGDAAAAAVPDELIDAVMANVDHRPEVLGEATNHHSRRF